MKGILTFIFTCSFLPKFFSQEDITFTITNYEVNGKNLNQHALEGNLTLSIYECAEDNLCLSNHFVNYDSQSFGRIYNVKRTYFKETETEYAYNEFQFTWTFENTYDNKTGTASVVMKYIYIENSIKIQVIIIVLNTNEILKFEGYREK